MIEGRARIIGSRQENGRTQLIIQLLGDETFELDKPDISEELDHLLLKMMRSIRKIIVKGRRVRA
jgi:hypothetical protein